MSTDLERHLRDLLAAKAEEVRTFPVAPPKVLHRAGRGEVRTVATAGIVGLFLIIGLFAAAQAVFDHGGKQTLGGNGSAVVLPTDGPNPGQTSLLLASGENGGEPWTLRVTNDPGSGLGLDFEYERLGGGGAGLAPMGGGRTFQGYGGSTSPYYPNHDPTQAPLPKEIAGEVIADATRVELQLERGPLLRATLYPLPEELVGPAKAFLLFVPGDTLLEAGNLVAYDASGNEIGRTYFDVSPVSLYPKVIEESAPDAVNVMKELQLAGAVAGRYFDTHGSFSGLDPETAMAISPEIQYNTSSTVIPGEVSLRVSGPQRLVLASATSTGEIYSACFTSGPNVSTYGRNDTSDSFACTNGWLDPSASPVPSSTETIASGSDPLGGLWNLSVVTSAQETDLEFLMSTLGIYMPLVALDGQDLGDIAAGGSPQPGAAQSLPNPVYGLASDRVARLELRTTDGRVFDGSLYPAPGVLDAEQAFLFLVPVDQAFSGTLVAYDASGSELEREPVPN